LQTLIAQNAHLNFELERLKNIIKELTAQNLN